MSIGKILNAIGSCINEANSFWLLRDFLHSFYLIYKEATDKRLHLWEVISSPEIL